MDGFLLGAGKAIDMLLKLFLIILYKIWPVTVMVTLGLLAIAYCLITGRNYFDPNKFDFETFGLALSPGVGSDVRVASTDLKTSPVSVVTKATDQLFTAQQVGDVLGYTYDVKACSGFDLSNNSPTQILYADAEKGTCFDWVISREAPSRDPNSPVILLWGVVDQEGGKIHYWISSGLNSSAALDAGASLQDPSFNIPITSDESTRLLMLHLAQIVDASK